MNIILMELLNLELDFMENIILQNIYLHLLI